LFRRLEAANVVQIDRESNALSPGTSAGAFVAQGRLMQTVGFFGA
jgi:hypothetical protein